MATAAAKKIPAATTTAKAGEASANGGGADTARAATEGNNINVSGGDAGDANPPTTTHKTPATRPPKVTMGRAAAQKEMPSFPEGNESGGLQSYLARLTKTPLLTPDEERRLAFKVADGGEAGAKAQARLVESNMRLVVSIAKAYRSSGIPFEDLIQEGAIGLMTASERFDPARGYRFSTYATQWIRQAIGRAVDNKSKAIRLPAHVSESLRKLDRVRSDLRRELGEEPTTEQLSDRTGLPARKVTLLLNTIQDPVSLDMQVGNEENISLGALLYDKMAPDPQDELVEAALKEEIASIFDCLDERELLIMKKRFGFDGEDAYVLQQIGDELNISRERVRQIETQALRKLRSAARARQLRDYIS